MGKLHDAVVELLAKVQQAEQTNNSLQGTIKKQQQNMVDLIEQNAWLKQQLESTGNNLVLQPWVVKLSMMQQSVLISGIRGPDTVQKYHVAKDLMRWYRRCILYSAFDKKILKTPHEEGGGGFTGSCSYTSIVHVLEQYMKTLDELPHHFHMHLMHGGQIIGYQHPDEYIADFWYKFYEGCVHDLHLRIETREEMEERLSDNKEKWQQRDFRWDSRTFYDNPILDYRLDGDT